MKLEDKKISAIAFIDAANIIYGAKKESGFKVDLKKLAKYLRTRFGVRRVYFYGGVNTKKIDFEKYQKMLEQFGLIPRLKKTKFYSQEPRPKVFTCKFCGKKNILKERKKIRAKANCDVELTIDALKNLRRFKEFIFLTGDGDFAPLLRLVKEAKREICVIASSKKTAREIREIAAERFIEIKNLKKIIAK